MSRKTPPPDGKRLAAAGLDRHRLSLRLRTAIPSTPEAIGTLTDEITAFADDIGLDENQRTDVAIALREALANAIIHGNRSDPSKRVLVRCYVDPEQGMLVAIRDEGKGFDPEHIPDPTSAERIHLHHGRGVFMMRELMDQVVHRKGGREIVLYKKRADAANDTATDPARDGASSPSDDS